MIKLEDLEVGMRVCGLVADQVVELKQVSPLQGYREFGSDESRLWAVTVGFVVEGIWQDRTLSREDESTIDLAIDHFACGDEGETGLLALEATLIRDAHLFHPWHALHTSDIDPLPHQIAAVYEDMLGRQPLRFLLADDPGAGKTIMAGLLIRELIARDDVRRCLICVPGSLVEQWKQELWSKFRLTFTLVTPDLIRASPTGNPFEEQNLLIVRLDQAKGTQKSKDMRDLLVQTDWDLIICDEAHKMSATFSGGRVNRSLRYELGEKLRDISRHFLLMTATPHNGKNEDFQLLLSLLDADRFENQLRYRPPNIDASDLYRRMMKEDLLTFEGKPLFPERKAYTVDYDLSHDECELYEEVTDYTRHEFNRAERLEEGRKNAVGFALTILQRRLASSPAAIYESLKSRRQRLEEQLQTNTGTSRYSEYDLDAIEDGSASEREVAEEKAIGNTTAQTEKELREEIRTLQRLERQAENVLRKGLDTKWNKLRMIWQQRLPEMEPRGAYRKLIIFTEHRPTLAYLRNRLEHTLGNSGSVVEIHGGIRHDKRREVERRFREDPRTQILVATDAAGEGINLQCAHLMVNYDLPWNPNRLEQRFGRIHRIGQTDVCHLWNLVAGETREGAVYKRLLEKIATERNALNGKVFDILGELFVGVPLRDLLKEAVRYGDRPDVKAKVNQAIDNATDQTKVRQLAKDHMLVTDNIDLSKLSGDMKDKHDVDAQARVTRDFLVRVMDRIPAARMIEREPGRFQVQTVPAVLREFAKSARMQTLYVEYDCICFEKAFIQPTPEHRRAEFVRAGHPLLDAALGWALSQWKRSTPECGEALLLLVDERGRDFDQAGLRSLYCLEWSIHNAAYSGKRHGVIETEARFVEIDPANLVRVVADTQHRKYRSATTAEQPQIEALISDGRASASSHETNLKHFALEQFVTPNLETIRKRELARINKVVSAVTMRLSREIKYQEDQVERFRNEESVRPIAKLNRSQAEQRVRDLSDRQAQRMAMLEAERKISASGISVRRVAVIVPAALLSE